jgi:poly-gamma-glutamate synthesis protein (capsule biosynthesis protein)
LAYPRKYKPVEAYSRQGKALVALIRAGLGLRYPEGLGWGQIWHQHHEDPLHMDFSELTYFAFKYYYRAITHPGPNYDAYNRFHKKLNSLRVPAGFKALHKVTLSAGGDLMPYKSINPQVCQHLWDECGDFFFGSDVVTANLETPVCASKTMGCVPEIMLRNMYFNADNSIFNVFEGLGRYKGYDVLSVANNHSLDQGETGLRETLNFLDTKGIQYCGASVSAAEQQKIPIIEKNEISIGFLAATFSLNAMQLPAGKPWLVNHLPLNLPEPDFQNLANQAKEARDRGADILVAHLHMGCAYQPYPSMHSIENIHAFCRATGVDIVLGGHPHNVQPIEIIDITDPFSGKAKQCFIIYSMGDFVAYDIFKWCHLPAMLRFTIGKRSSETYITSVEIKLAYMQAEISENKVKSLRLRDYNKLLNNNDLKDKRSQQEFEELSQFANNYLLPGNIGELLV